MAVLLLFAWCIWVMGLRKEGGGKGREGALYVYISHSSYIPPTTTLDGQPRFTATWHGLRRHGPWTGLMPMSFFAFLHRVSSLPGGRFPANHLVSASSRPGKKQLLLAVSVAAIES